jgi:hypothetical protein
MELPEETRTSAAAMRRVVAEQIEALSELNAIVRAQSATHDLSDRRPAAPRAEPRPEPVRAAEQPRPAPAPVQAPPAQPAPAPRTVTVAEAPRVVTAPVAEAPKPKTDDANGGWLRDVLRNANAPAAAPAAAPVQNLTSLTDEIARAIDPAALSEAWEQYQMGAQNVFSRRIYTLTGQSTFDQVKRRITSDVEFGKNAMSYMTEFEQLLQRAAQGGDPVGETRAILLSDRGKVYTMLAHASGRLA